MAGSSVQRILLVRLSSLGDVLQALPALAAVRAAHPSAEVGWLVERRFAAALEGQPHLDRLFVFERRKAGRLPANVAAAWRVVRALRGWRPDVAVDLQGNAKSALLARLSGAPRRLGLARGESREVAHLLATETAPAADEAREHRTERALRVVAPLAGDARGAAVLPPPSEAACERIGAALAAAGVGATPFALLLPGTSDFGAFKRWPAARFAALAERLTANGAACLVGYAAEQRDLAESVVQASAGAVSLAPQTRDLHELRALVERADLVVGPDSGPLTLAALAGRPTVVLFGPKDPLVYAPRGDRATGVWKGVYCSPCTLRRCADPICMTTLDADEVLTGVRRVLAGAG